MKKLDFVLTPIDLMLKNNIATDISILVILMISFIVFKKINKMNYFFIAIFLAIKFTFSSYVDDYIERKRELKLFKETHFISVKVLLSLIVSIPFLILGFFLGKHVPLDE